MKRDLIVSIVLLVGIVSLYLTLGWIELPGARTFPRVILIIMAVLSALLLVQSLMLKSLTEAKKTPFPIGRFLICFCLIIVYFIFMETLGFYLSAFLFFVAVSFILGRSELTLRTGFIRAGIGLIFTGVLFFLFKVLLAVQTPKGLFI